MSKFLFLLLFSFSLFAKAPFNVEDEYFIKGYDPVSYIKSSKAVKGKKEFRLNYEGVEILFSSLDNKKVFEAQPSKYLPEYNGYCAYAMADSGDLVEVDPKSFKVINGKTYLFYDGFFADTLKLWNKKQDDQGQITSADKNWLKHKK